MKNIISIVILTVLSASVGASEKLIAIEGVGVISVVPDQVRIEFDINNGDIKGLLASKNYVDNLSSAIVSELIKLGLSESDITSTAFYIGDREYYYDKECDSASESIVRRSMSVTVRDLSRYNDVVNLLVNNGVDGVGDFSTDVSNIEDLKMEALKLAIEDSKQRASFLASQYGRKLGRVVNIGFQKFQNRVNMGEEILIVSARRRDESQLPYQFSPENIDVMASVYVEFELK